jgi:hypothetical protein
MVTIIKVSGGLNSPALSPGFGLADKEMRLEFARAFARYTETTAVSVTPVTPRKRENYMTVFGGRE